MSNYIFQIEINIYSVAVICDTVCIIAGNKAEAQQAANRLALNWWGMPNGYDPDVRWWLIRNDESGDAHVSAVPKFMCRASEAELKFLKRARNPIHQVKAAGITDESIIATILEAQEYGMEAVDHANLTGLFGDVVASHFAATSISSFSSPLPVTPTHHPEA